MNKQEWFVPIYQRTFDPEPIFFKDYLINEYGKVYSLKTKKRLTPGTDKDGYYFYGLNLNGKKYSCMTARLVAQTFIPNEDRMLRPIVNHIDGNITNNHKSNLEWVTHSENTKKYYELKKSGKKSTDFYDKKFYTKVSNQLNIFDELNEQG